MGVKAIVYHLLIGAALGTIIFPNVFGQGQKEQVDWLSKHAVPIESNDFSSSLVTAYLDEALSGRQVVMLGEQNHGDGSTFELYGQLVKLLHQRYGFEAIVFESGFYDCHRAWQQIRAGQDAFTAFRASVFGVWTKSKQAQPVFTYLKEQALTANPLLVAGFDCQLTGSYGIQHFLPELDSLASILDARYVRSKEYQAFLKVSSSVATPYYKPQPIISPEELLSFQSGLIWLTELLKNVKEEDSAFWIQELENLQVEVENKQGTLKLTTGEVTARNLINARDKQMARNVVWLLEGPLKGKKVILWGNVSHFLKKAASLIPASGRDLFNGSVTMGDYLLDKYGEKVYLIGSLSYQGQSGQYSNPSKQEAVLPPAGSLNHLLHLTGQKVSFLNLARAKGQNLWISRPLIARLDGATQFEADWTKVFDGILFIETMEASTPSER